MNTVAKFAAAAALALLPVTAQSAVVDFTSKDFASATGFAPKGKTGSGIIGFGDTRVDDSGLDPLFGTLAFDVTATGGKLRHNKQERRNGDCLGILDCGIDGLGVGNDEITGKKKNAQSIQVDFGRSVWINELYFLDLFGGKDDDDRKHRRHKDEDDDDGHRGESATVDILGSDAAVIATYSISRSGAVLSDGAVAELDTDVDVGNDEDDDDRNNGGFVRFDLSANSDNFLQATGLVFRALRGRGDDGNNDFALAGIAIADVTAVSQVPLPPGGVLFISALVGLAYLGRRKARAA